MTFTGVAATLQVRHHDEVLEPYTLRRTACLPDASAFRPTVTSVADGKVPLHRDRAARIWASWHGAGLRRGDRLWFRLRWVGCQWMSACTCRCTQQCDSATPAVHDLRSRTSGLRPEFITIMESRELWGADLRVC
jgi:hypothetical protein